MAVAGSERVLLGSSFSDPAHVASVSDFVFSGILMGAVLNLRQAEHSEESQDPYPCRQI